jgi:2',3'-cyclic-nucleotide 2'-phosphodiesterase (5'-nucleotidase family)
LTFAVGFQAPETSASGFGSEKLSPRAIDGKVRNCLRSYRNKMQIIHSSDNESSFQDPNSLEEKILGYSAVVEGLREVARQKCIPSIHLTAGDHTIPGPFYQAAEEVDFLGAPGIGDILMFNAMDVEGNGMGNHEFDGGIEEFATMLTEAEYPFLSVNLDFSDVELESGTPEIRIGRDAGPCFLSRGKVVKSCWTFVGRKRVGLIGRAPGDFFNIIEDPINTLGGLDFVGGRDPETNLAFEDPVDQINEQVALLERRGIKRIVLLNHAQDFDTDEASFAKLRGVDIIVEAGATGFQSKAEKDAFGPFNFLRPEDEENRNAVDYPLVLENAEGETVLTINSDQQYRYVGNLIVEFDRRGRIVAVDERSGPVATTPEAVELLAKEIGKSIAADDDVVTIFDALQGTPSIVDAFTVVGETDFPLNGARADVRSRETNLGNLAADSTIWGAEQEGFTVDVALKNGGGIRDTIDGPIIIRLAVQAALAFDNKLSVVRMTGDQLLAAMENAVSRAEFTDGRFPQVAGMVLEFDDTNFPPLEGQATVTTPSRVRNLTITKSDSTVVQLVEDGVAGNLSGTFVLATNSFLLTGGDGYAAIAASDVLGETTIGEQQILEDYIIQELDGTVSIEDDPANPQRVFRLGN